jgi:hypothetical protein
MVLIPLITMFLIATQLTIAIHGRNLAKTSAQDGASRRAISGNFLPSDIFVHIDSPDSNQNLDLVVSRQQGILPALIPGLRQIMGREPGIQVSGLAVIENQR